MATVTQPHATLRAFKLRAMTLYTIPFSHYCELARWSLQEAKVSFVEQTYLPGIHSFFGPMQRIRKRCGNSSSTGKGQGTPLYLAPDGSILDDSWQILELAGLGSMPDEMKWILEKEIGPQSRSIVYADLLPAEKDEIFYNIGKASPFGCRGQTAHQQGSLHLRKDGT